MRNFFNHLGSKKTLLKNSALDALRNHNNKYNKEMSKKKELVDMVGKRLDLLKRHVFNELRKNNDKAREEMDNQKRKINQLLGDLQKSQREK
jgi:hypothetical protein